MTAIGCLRRWRQALPWCGLVGLSLAGAQVLQVVAASLLPPDPALGVLSSSRQLDVQGAGLTGSEGVVLMVTMQDPSTGRDAVFLCRTTRDRLSTNPLLVDADAVRNVSRSCDSLRLAAPVLPNG